MERIAVIGTGLIGRAWAIVFARAGHEVALYDADASAMHANLAIIDTSLEDLRKAGLIDEPAERVRQRIRAAGSFEDALEGAGYVQENVLETLEAKRDIFARMDAIAPAATILASSTSTIPASSITEKLAGRARCLVAHPVNPPYLVPLVELSPAPWTAPATVERARELLEAAGQVPIVVRREIQGFILNRLQAALVCEAMRLFEEGYASTEDIDKCVRNGLGLRWSFMGPFETIDLNAPGGILDYAARYGPLLCAIAGAKPWEREMLGRAERERRQHLPLLALAERAAWRDRRLMALRRHQKDQ